MRRFTSVLSSNVGRLNSPRVLLCTVSEVSCVKVSLVSENSARLDWNPQSSHHSYRLEYSRLPDGPYNLHVGSMSWSILKNLKPGSLYGYTISTIDKDAVSVQLYTGNFSTAQVLSGHYAENFIITF